MPRFSWSHVCSRPTWWRPAGSLPWVWSSPSCASSASKSLRTCGSVPGHLTPATRTHRRTWRMQSIGWSSMVCWDWDKVTILGFGRFKIHPDNQNIRINTNQTRKCWIEVYPRGSAIYPGQEITRRRGTCCQVAIYIPGHIRIDWIKVQCGSVKTRPSKFSFEYHKSSLANRSMGCFIEFKVYSRHA